MKEVQIKLIQKLSIKLCIVKLHFQKSPFFFGVLQVFISLRLPCEFPEAAGNAK